VWRPWVAKIQGGSLLKEVLDSNALGPLDMKLKDVYFRATSLKCHFCEDQYSHFLHGRCSWRDLARVKP
jgi:hypothetical protein